MTKAKKRILMGASYAAVAALAVSGTLALLADESQDYNTMTLGNVSIEQHEYQRVADKDGKFATDTIDNVTSYVLEEFEQDKIIVPVAANPGTSGAPGWDDTIVRMTQVDSYGSMQMFEDKSAQDKLVVVENTGKSDAYIRTVVAIECGETDGSLIGRSERAIKADEADKSTQPWLFNEIGKVEIDGNNYILIEYLYRGASDVDRHVGGILPSGDTSYPNLSQVYLRSEATNEDCELIDGNDNGTLDILVVSQAVQTGSFENAEAALDAGFGDITKDNHPWVDDDVFVEVNADNAEAALTEDKPTIIVNLTEDVTYDVAAWSANSMGGKSTEDIIINGNGHTITFNQTNSDWNNVVTANDAVLTIKDAHITNSGNNDGPWNSHDINFDCPVVLKNVTSDKAIALKDDGTFNNVVINDANTSDTYALWIQPNGQTVTLDGCTIDMLDCTDGRGIKIDEQYVKNPSKVTLKVSDTTFKTEEKSAIIVKSVAGADIVLDEIDISGVAADTKNAVWVDEASSAYYDEVTVTGGSKVQE